MEQPTSKDPFYAWAQERIDTLTANLTVALDALDEVWPFLWPSSHPQELRDRVWAAITLLKGEG